MNVVLIISGSIALIIGCIGIVVPVLPTTPFILLASWCFFRGSPRMHSWLKSSFLKTYIEKYEKEKGMTKRSKAVTIALMWVMLLFSSLFIKDTLTAYIILPLLGVVGSATIIFFVPNSR
jgi:uncharacterized protein